MKCRLFLSVTGDYPNIGDAFIRREAVRWVRDVGPALVYARDAPDGWIRQVGTADGDLVMKSGRFSWVLAALRRPRAVVAFEPGEVLLNLAALTREVLFLMMIAGVRVRGGVVFLPPRAVVGGNRITLFVHRLSCNLADVALWREPQSAAAVGAGNVSPDIGFGGKTRTGLDLRSRKNVVVSLRGKRSDPTDSWIDALRGWARSRGFSIVTVAQVREDEDRSRALAERLGGTYLAWEGEDMAHEERLRRLYDTSCVAISDRLHVLIVASLSGVVPAELVAKPAPKVQTHFDQIGFRGVSRDATKLDAEQFGAFLDSQIERARELRERVKDAQAQLAIYKSGLRERIWSKSS